MGKGHSLNPLKIENSPDNCDSSFLNLFFISKRGTLVYKIYTALPELTSVLVSL